MAWRRLLKRWSVLLLVLLAVGTIASKCKSNEPSPQLPPGVGPVRPVIQDDGLTPNQRKGLWTPRP